MFATADNKRTIGRGMWRLSGSCSAISDPSVYTHSRKNNLQSIRSPPEGEIMQAISRQKHIDYYVMTYTQRAEAGICRSASVYTVI